MTIDLNAFGVRQGRQVLLRWKHFIADILLLAASFMLVYLLRYDFAIPKKELPAFQAQLLLAVPLQALTLVMAGVYAFVWRYIGLREMRSFLFAASFWSFSLFTLRFGLPSGYTLLRPPISVIAMDTILALVVVISVRILRRSLYESYERSEGILSDSGTRPRRVLLIGAGLAGKAALDELRRDCTGEMMVVGFVDDDRQKLKAMIHGARVLGTVAELPKLVAEFDIDDLVISMTSPSRATVRRILDVCEKLSVKVKILPSPAELVRGGRVTIVREIDVVDLLGREPVHSNPERLSEFLCGKVVMITGAGGSIGSELVRQVAMCKPANIVLVERAEPALFRIEFELRSFDPNLSVTPLLSDAANLRSMVQAFSRHRPQIVLHAAAHKHVPIVETNVSESVVNNVLATRTVGELAGQFGAELMLLISTDKAVRPKSMLGLTKRTAELVIRNLNQKYDCAYVAVRFGNVLGSAGSVIPVFQDQIRRGGPVTVTDRNMVRYFMTIPEAALLVLEAGALGKGGELFILDMGQPVRILSLAEDVIRLSGLRPYADIEIVFTGIRPGEKIEEELSFAEEAISRTIHPKIFIGKLVDQHAGDLDSELDALESLAHLGDDLAVRNALLRLIPESQLTVEYTVAQDLAYQETKNALSRGWI